MSRIPLGANRGVDAGQPKPATWSIDVPDQYGAAERIPERRGITHENVDRIGLSSPAKAARRRPRAASTARWSR